jgi:hypothetical protein
VTLPYNDRLFNIQFEAETEKLINYSVPLDWLECFSIFPVAHTRSSISAEFIFSHLITSVQKKTLRGHRRKQDPEINGIRVVRSGSQLAARSPQGQVGHVFNLARRKSLRRDFAPDPSASRPIQGNSSTILLGPADINLGGRLPPGISDSQLQCNATDTKNRGLNGTRPPASLAPAHADPIASYRNGTGLRSGTHAHIISSGNGPHYDGPVFVQITICTRTRHDPYVVTRRESTNLQVTSTFWSGAHSECAVAFADF